MKTLLRVTLRALLLLCFSPTSRAYAINGFPPPISPPNFYYGAASKGKIAAIEVLVRKYADGVIGVFLLRDGNYGWFNAGVSANGTMNGNYFYYSDYLNGNSHPRGTFTGKFHKSDAITCTFTGAISTTLVALKANRHRKHPRFPPIPRWGLGPPAISGELMPADAFVFLPLLWVA